MTENTAVDGRSRVALELLHVIIAVEPNEQKNRKYYLDLMIECYKAAGGESSVGMRVPDEVLKVL